MEEGSRDQLTVRPLVGRGRLPVGRLEVVSEVGDQVVPFAEPQVDAAVFPDDPQGVRRERGDNAFLADAPERQQLPRYDAELAHQFLAHEDRGSLADGPPLRQPLADQAVEVLQSFLPVVDAQTDMCRVYCLIGHVIKNIAHLSASSSGSRMAGRCRRVRDVSCVLGPCLTSRAASLHNTATGSPLLVFRFSNSRCRAAGRRNTPAPG